MLLEDKVLYLFTIAFSKLVKDDEGRYNVCVWFFFFFALLYYYFLGVLYLPFI